jgi:hypothetical protein
MVVAKRCTAVRQSEGGTPENPALSEAAQQRRATGAVEVRTCSLR